MPEPASYASQSSPRLSESPYTCPCATPLTASTGPVPSTSTDTALVASTFPAASTERYPTTWLPSPVTFTGSAYGFHSPPSSWYSVRETPEVASSAVSATVTSPPEPLVSAAVTGAVPSTSTSSWRTSSTLPASSVDRYRTV